MGEIAHLRAGALQDLPVGVEQEVQLACERRDVARIFAGDPLRLAAADGAQCAAQIGERAQAETDLQQRREAQRHAEKREGDGEREDEVPHRRVDLVGGAGDADDVTSVLAEVDVALDDA